MEHDIISINIKLTNKSIMGWSNGIICLPSTHAWNICYKVTCCGIVNLPLKNIKSTLVTYCSKYTHHTLDVIKEDSSTSKVFPSYASVHFPPIKPWVLIKPELFKRAATLWASVLICHNQNNNDFISHSTDHTTYIMMEANKLLKKQALNLKFEKSLNKFSTHESETVRENVIQISYNLN